MRNAASAVPPVEKSPGGPLTAEHHRELALARQRSKSIRKAARVAGFNGWATAIVAALSAPFALFSLSGALVFIAVSVVAYNEFRGRKRLLQFDQRAAAFLGWNQIGLLAIIVGYSLWAIHTNLNQASSVSAQLEAYAELDSALGSMGEFETLAKQIVLLFYGSVIVISVVFQGLNAIYYFSRRAAIDSYVRDTPKWVRDLQCDTFPT
ncbi:MAG TPA: hypothetical protein VGK58_14045 [Lacipirellulaceae bacterium]